MRDYADPPGMPEDERMTPAEFRMVRDFLGLDLDWLAAHLDVNVRSIRRWERGEHPIPDGVRLEMEHLEQLTAAEVDLGIRSLMDLPEPGVWTYRSGLTPGGWPAKWHRLVVARIAQEVPGLIVSYPPNE